MDLAIVLVMGSASAAASVTISRTHVFKPLREWVESRSERAGELISCHYCTSHWIGAMVVAGSLAYRDHPGIVQLATEWLAVVGVGGVVSTGILAAK